MKTAAAGTSWENRLSTNCQPHIYSTIYKFTSYNLQSTFTHWLLQSKLCCKLPLTYFHIYNFLELFYVKFLVLIKYFNDLSFWNATLRWTGKTYFNLGEKKVWQCSLQSISWTLLNKTKADMLNFSYHKHV